jgi:hypothetical protein
MLLLLLLRWVPGSKLLVLHEAMLEREIDRQRGVMQDMCKVRRQGILGNVERNTVRQVLRRTLMCKLRWRASLHMLWETRKLRMHEVRWMLPMRRIGKVDKRVRTLPVLWLLLRSMSIRLGCVPVRQLMWVCLLNGTCAILTRTVCELPLRHHHLPCFILWDLGGDLVAFRQMILCHPRRTNPGLSRYCTAQKLLQDQFRVVLPVPLQVCSLILRDRLVVVVHSDDVGVRSVLVVRRPCEDVLMELTVVRNVCDDTVAAADRTFDLNTNSVADHVLFFEFLRNISNAVVEQIALHRLTSNTKFTTQSKSAIE